MGKMLSIIPERCTGCRSCELACSMKKVGEFNPGRSAIRVGIFLDEAVYLPLTCLQCEEAWCAKVCPASALVKEPDTGVIVLKKERCVGCKMCVLACPFGVIKIDEGKALKCDLCNGEPECVLFCTPQALEYKSEDISILSKQRNLYHKLRAAYKASVQVGSQDEEGR